MKTIKLLPVILFITSQNIYAQSEKPKLYESEKINDSTKIIGIYPHFDKNKTFKDLNFLIEDQKEIKNLVDEFKLGEEIPNSMDDPNFRIIVLQNFKNVNSWIVSPLSEKVLTNGHTYKFNIDKIKKLHKKHPFNYKFEKVFFKSKDEFQQYLNKQKSNLKFLFSYNPVFKYEGSFEIQFPRNERFSSPKAISQYLRPSIEKIVSSNDFSVSYKANEFNLKNQDQFTMTITGSKNIFEKLTIDNLKNKNWTPTEESGTFFYIE